MSSVVFAAVLATERAALLAFLSFAALAAPVVLQFSPALRTVALTVAAFAAHARLFAA